MAVLADPATAFSLMQAVAALDAAADRHESGSPSWSLIKAVQASATDLVEHEVNNWTYGMIDTVSDAVIDRYRANSTVFTIMGRSGALTPGTESGVAVVSGLTASNVIAGVEQQTTFTLSDLAQAGQWTLNRESPAFRHGEFQFQRYR